MKKFQLLLLDTNVILYLFELGIWDNFVKACDVHLERTIIDQCKYYEDVNGDKHPIDLSSYVECGDIVEETTDLTELISLKDKFGPAIIKKLDDGEAESLALITERNNAFLICSGDAIVYRVLGAQCMSSQGLSLESILKRIGLSRQLEPQYTEKFCNNCLQRGFQEGLQGLASLK